MSSNLWMPMYWGDYLRDTQHLSTTEHGAYLLLIAYYWQNGGNLPLPKGGLMGGMMGGMNEALYRVCRAFTKDERDAVDTVLEKYFTIDHDGFHHKRVDKELERRQDLHNKLSESGKKGVAARLGKSKPGFNAGLSQALNQASSPPPIPAQARPQPQLSKTDNPLPPKPVDNVDNSHTPPEVFMSSGQGKGELPPGILLTAKGPISINQLLDDATIKHARAKAPGWDLYRLAQTFADNVAQDKHPKPDKPRGAFVAWCGKYTKGQRPA